MCVCSVSDGDYLKSIFHVRRVRGGHSWAALCVKAHTFEKAVLGKSQKANGIAAISFGVVLIGILRVVFLCVS